MKKAALRVRLDAGYRDHVILRDLCLDLAPGERLGLLGASGAGKSTLVLALFGLLPHRGGWARGEVEVDGRNLLTCSDREARSLRGRTLALVPQSSIAALNPALSLQVHFEHAWRAHRDPRPADLQRRITELLDRVTLPHSPDFLKRKPGQISVGQAQRCTLALALLHQPSVIIADEPTSALDAVTQHDVTALLRETSEESGTALLFVSHDLLSVLRLCTGVALLSEGCIGERLAFKDLLAAKHPSLRRILATLPVPVDVLVRNMDLVMDNGTEVSSTELLPTPSL